MPHWSTYKSESELRNALVANARAYVGVRYRHQGHTREHGLDCLGLLIVNAREFGFEFGLNDGDESYSFDPNGYHLVERLSAEMVLLPTWREALPGDIVLMRWHIENPPQHVGIVTSIEPDNLVCVHSSRHARRVTETRWDREDLVTNAFRIKEVAQLGGQP